MYVRIATAALFMASTGCGTLMLGSPAYSGPEAQRCVENALRRAPDPDVLPAARARFERACDNGDPAGCSSLGVMYERGLVVAKDGRRAATLYQKACKGGNDAGCVHLGRAYLHGAAVRADAERAALLFEMGCDGGHPQGCAELGSLHLRGRGVARDVPRGAELLARACDEEPEACFQLALAYEDGLVAVDPLRTLELYEKSCMGGIALACDRMSERMARPLPFDAPRPAPHPAEQACAMGSARDCAAAGLAYYAGQGVPRDLGRAVGLLTRACTGGYEPACSVVTPLLDGSCQRGDEASCRALSHLSR